MKTRSRNGVSVLEVARFNAMECQDTDRLEIDARSLRLLIEAPAYDAFKGIADAIQSAPR